MPAALLLASLGAHAETLTFQRALDLAMGHSTAMGIAVADQARARSLLSESRNAYIPQLVVGSGAAKSWGFPLTIEGSAPAIFNVNTQSFLFNAAQREFIRAARTDWLASSTTTQDRRQQTILDVALTYNQLDKATAKLRALTDESEHAEHAQTVMRARLQEGIQSKADLVRASLAVARARMRVAETQGTVDLLRQHLSQLTGVPANEIEVDPDSMPPLPEVDPNGDLTKKALASNTAVAVADQQAKAKELRALGEHKQLYPAVDLVGQYGLFTRYNNYDVYFQRFQRNNATVGVVVRFPLLNFAQRAHAEAADAEALRARREAEAVRNQVSADTLKLQALVQQLTAARDVAQLEYELGQSDYEVVQAKARVGTASIPEQESARITINEKFAALQDVSFELDKARLQLLRITGELEKWALR